MMKKSLKNFIVFSLLGSLFLGGLKVYAETSGGLTLPQGGLGITTVAEGNILVGSDGNRLTSTSSPTVGYITATSTTASTFQNLTVTGTCTGCGAASAQSVATSTAETSTYVPYWTSTGASPATLGSDAGMVYADTANRLTVTYASTTGFTVSGTADIGTLVLGNALGLAYGGTNATSFTTSGNAVYYNGTALATAPLTSAVTTPYASSTSQTISGALFNTALTSGRVPYITTSGQFTDSANLTYDGSTLGITGDLTVSGTTTTQGLAVPVFGVVYGDAGMVAKKFTATSTTDTSAFSGNLTVTGTTGLTGLLTAVNASTTQISSTGSSYFATGGGNVGIGTAAPRTLFDVTSGTANTAGSAAPNLALFTGPKIVPITNGTTEANVSIMSNTAQAIDVGASLMLGGRYTDASTVSTGFASFYGAKENGTSNNLSGYLAIYTNRAATQTEAVRITSAGKVGIGTTAPLYALDVAGSIYSHANLSEPANGGTTGVTGDRLISYQATGYRSAIGMSTTGLYIQSTHNAGAAVDGIRFFGGTDGTAAEVMRIQSSGNVGIGTTAPGKNLDVIGDIRASVDIYTGSRYYSGTGTADYPAYSFTADTDTGMHRALGANILGFSTAGTNKMTILENGNVGIGTTSPANKLDVYTNTLGSGVGFGEASQYLPTIKFYRYAGGPSTIGAYQLVVGETGQSAGSDLSFKSGGYGTRGGEALTTKVTFTNTGNVGIGTTGPTANLHVYSSAGATAKIDGANGNASLSFINNLTETRLSIGSAGGVQFINNAYNANYLAFKSGGTTQMVMNTSGNVGIGTTSPQSILSVGNTNGINFTTATSTFNTTGGIIIANGCLSILNGSTCITGKIDTAFIFATSTLGTGTTTLKISGFKEPTTFKFLGCTNIGPGTFVARQGTGSASSTAVISSTGNTTTFTTLSSNNSFTSGQAIYFEIGSVSGTTTNPSCSYQRTTP